MDGFGRIFGPGRGGGGDGEGTHWLSVSDLMAGLMVIFLFLAIAYMQEVRHDRDQMEAVAQTYQETKSRIYAALLDEFADDLTRWDAGVDSLRLAFEFRSPEVLFEHGQSAIRPRFEEILEDFFPRYVATVEPYRGVIEEVRIEGHTSSDWSGVDDAAGAYFLNMELSQGRTQSVLSFAHDLPAVGGNRDWIRSTFAAVGFSSSRPVLGAGGREDTERSRRVTFRIITNAERQIERILAREGG
jgi:outer membrane protein OmpA-like peptidoglycan-associated protein